MRLLLAVVVVDIVSTVATIAHDLARVVATFATVVSLYLVTLLDSCSDIGLLLRTAAK